MSKPKEIKTTTTTTVTTEVITPQPATKEMYEYFVLDRSGSMGGIWNSTVDSLNEYLNKAQRDAQKLELPTFCSITLFDDEMIDTVTLQNINAVGQVSKTQHGPRGGTALNDAVARAINKLKAHLGGRAASNDVGVNITIFTDGYENQSKEFPGSNNAALRALVEHAKNEYKWNIVYVGVGTQEAVTRAAANVGINASNVRSHTGTMESTVAMFADMERSRGAYTAKLSKGVKDNADYFALPPKDEGK